MATITREQFIKKVRDLMVELDHIRLEAECYPNWGDEEVDALYDEVSPHTGTLQALLEELQV